MNQIPDIDMSLPANEATVKELKADLLELRALGRVISMAEQRIVELKNEERNKEVALHDQMEAFEIDSLKLDGTTFFRRVDRYLSIKKKRKPQAYLWLIEKDFKHLITKTVNARSLTAVLLEWEKDGGEVDTELFNYTPVKRIGQRNAGR